METFIIKADDEEGLDRAAAALRDGKLVAFPTETVYGLGANALDTNAVKSIYEAKGRPSDNPLIVHISHTRILEKLVLEVPEKAKKLMDFFWPGPLTLIMKRTDFVPDIITAGLDTVAIRMPDNALALKLIDKAGVPVAAPSANLSGHPSPTTAKHVEDDLKGRVEYIIDGGPCNVGVESTVLDVTGEIPVILRPGGVTREMLEKIVGKVESDLVIKIEDGQKPRSPGMKYRHYSPRAEMYLVSGESDKVVIEINELTEKSKEKGLKVGVLSTEENMHRYIADIIISVGSVDTPEDIAANLFDSLRKFDENNVDIIYSETISEEGIGKAVMNRLMKASSGKIIKV
ncbi:MAG: threonylcarbamoyl-AMP synthase [Clostridiaceae bacterium]|nr:threonylcarbamoyl-AMP synthase [Clostridiaceae bacterium]